MEKKKGISVTILAFVNCWLGLMLKRIDEKFTAVLIAVVVAMQVLFVLSHIFLAHRMRRVRQSRKTLAYIFPSPDNSN